MAVPSVNYKAFVLLLAMMVTPVFADVVDEARGLANEMDYDRAIPLLEKHLEQNPADQDALRLLAKIYAWNTNYDKAVAVYDRLLEYAPDNINYTFEKARALVWLNQNAQALPLLEKCWRQLPENSEAWRLYILILDQSGSKQNKQRARELFEQAKKKFPNVPWEFM
jgi:cytochrome c-type biogenesis protein CcmH/NrfG